jgi:hypothetical protein
MIIINRSFKKIRGSKNVSVNLVMYLIIKTVKIVIIPAIHAMEFHSFHAYHVIF